MEVDLVISMKDSEKEAVGCTIKERIRYELIQFAKQRKHFVKSLDQKLYSRLDLFRLSSC